MFDTYTAVYESYKNMSNLFCVTYYFWMNMSKSRTSHNRDTSVLVKAITGLFTADIFDLSYQKKAQVKLITYLI